MIKLTEKSRKILRAIFRGVGMGVVSLSLGACPAPMYGPEPKMYGPSPDMYGMPPDRIEYEVLFTGKVISKKSGEPIKGIAIYTEYTGNYILYTTDLYGQFYFYVEKKDNYTIIFTDVDGEANGGRFKQFELKLTQEEADALRDNPIIIELEDELDAQ